MPSERRGCGPSATRPPRPSWCAAQPMPSWISAATCSAMSIPWPPSFYALLARATLCDAFGRPFESDVDPPAVGAVSPRKRRPRARDPGDRQLDDVMRVQLLGNVPVVTAGPSRMPRWRWWTASLAVSRSTAATLCGGRQRCLLPARLIDSHWSPSSGDLPPADGSVRLRLRPSVARAALAGAGITTADHELALPRGPSCACLPTPRACRGRQRAAQGVPASRLPRSSPRPGAFLRRDGTSAPTAPPAPVVGGPPPGQGQYRDLATYKAALCESRPANDTEWDRAGSARHGARP